MKNILFHTYIITQFVFFFFIIFQCRYIYTHTFPRTHRLLTILKTLASENTNFSHRAAVKHWIANAGLVSISQSVFKRVIVPTYAFHPNFSTGRKGVTLIVSPHPTGGRSQVAPLSTPYLGMQSLSVVVTSKRFTHKYQLFSAESKRRHSWFFFFFLYV